MARQKSGIRWARTVERYWLENNAAELADDAQTAYLAALAFADDIRADARQQTKHWTKKRRAEEIAACERHAAAYTREARRNANHPVQPSKRVTGADADRLAAPMANAIFRKNGRRRSLRGLYHQRSAQFSAMGLPSYHDSNASYSRAVGLYGSKGLRAVIITAGVERELLAQLVAVLQRFDDARK